MYDLIDRLTDSLRSWSGNATGSGEPFNRRELNELNATALTELFPGCTLERVDSLNGIRIKLPRYMDLLETGLLLMDDSNPTMKPARKRWMAPVFQSDGGLWIDGAQVWCDSAVGRDSVLFLTIRRRLTELRTLGLPFGLFNCPTGDSAQPLTVTVRGRDSRRIEFTRRLWLQSLRRITAGRLVYAGLLEAKAHGDSAVLTFYVLITAPGAAGHHFLKWRESWECGVSNWSLTATTVDFVPYVRTDNLQNLFAEPKRTLREPMDVRIR